MPTPRDDPDGVSKERGRFHLFVGQWSRWGRSKRHLHTCQNLRGSPIKSLSWGLRGAAGLVIGRRKNGGYKERFPSVIREVFRNPAVVVVVTLYITPPTIYIYWVC